MNYVDFFVNLFRNPQEAQKFKMDPKAYIEDKGVEDASYEELTEAATLACSPSTVNQGAQVTTGGSAATQGGGSATATSAPPAPSTGHTPPTSPPPPPPPPPADMPPEEVVQQVVNHYVTNVYDNDTNIDNSVTTNIEAGDNADIDVTNDNDPTTVVGDGIAIGGDSDVDGLALGDNSVAAGGDINAPVNTGTNTGIMNDGGDVNANEAVFGNDNTVVQDSTNTAIGSQDVVQADGGGVAAGENVVVTTIGDNADLDNNSFGVGNTTVSDDDVALDVNIQDSFNQDNDGLDVDLDLGGLGRDPRSLAAEREAKLVESAGRGSDSGDSGDSPDAALLREAATTAPEPPPDPEPIKQIEEVQTFDEAPAGDMEMTD